VWHLHDYIGWRPLTRALLARYAASTTSIVANSRSVAADAAEVLGPHRPIRAIHNAVDLRAFHPDGPRVDLDELSHLPRAAPGVVRVGLVGVFSRWKGHDVFLRALAGIPPHLPVRGYVVGDSLHATAGSQTTQEVLGRRAAALGLGGRVGFTGFLPPAGAMRSLDVVVHASTRPEPFGMVIAEAMACGRPVITTGSGGAGEIVEPERDAVVSAAGDPDALARAIVRLAGDASLRERLGRAARDSARRRFDPERLTGDVLELYERFEEHRSAAVRRPVA
jgi:glycosyltransferase involved in cell wall biosynthesis